MFISYKNHFYLIKIIYTIWAYSMNETKFDFLLPHWCDVLDAHNYMQLRCEKRDRLAVE